MLSLPRSTVEITEEQYKQGAVDYTAVYLFQITLTEQQDQLAVAQGDIASRLNWRLSVRSAAAGKFACRRANLSASVFGPPAIEDIASAAGSEGKLAIDQINRREHRFTKSICARSSRQLVTIVKRATFQFLFSHFLLRLRGVDFTRSAACGRRGTYVRLPSR